MASSTPNTILLQRNADGAPTVFERTVATAVVMPGMYVLFASGSVKPHDSAADVDAPNIMALENAYIDPNVTTTAPIDSSYAVGKKAKLFFPQTGDLLYAFLEAGANVAEGAPLQHNGAGYLEPYTSGKIVAYAAEAKDNSGGGSAVRIRVWSA